MDEATRTPFETDSVWKAEGRGFAMGVASDGDGVWVHLTGQVAWDAEERIVGPGDVAVQARQCLSNIESLLAAVGGTLEDLVSVTTYYTSREQLPAIQAVRNEAFAVGREPASTSIMVAGLGHPDFLVELTPIAFVPRFRYRAPTSNQRPDHDTR